MIKALYTPANSDHLSDLQQKIESVLPLNRFGDIPHWSSDCISADQVYRIQKLVQRVIEETGVIIQGQIIELFEVKNKLFPYNMQLIKIDRSIFDTDIIIEKQICQTITPLKNECITYVLNNNIGPINIDELIIGEYALATYWTELRDPKYKNWFIGKYMQRYV